MRNLTKPLARKQTYVYGQPVGTNTYVFISMADYPEYESTLWDRANPSYSHCFLVVITCPCHHAIQPHM